MTRSKKSKLGHQPGRPGARARARTAGGAQLWLHRDGVDRRPTRATAPSTTSSSWVPTAARSGELEKWIISKEQGDMEDLPEDLPDQLGEWNGTLEENPTVTLD